MLHFSLGRPVINFTQSVYDVNEDRKAVVGIYVTQNKVIAPLTVRCVIFLFFLNYMFSELCHKD